MTARIMIHSVSVVT